MDVKIPNYQVKPLKKFYRPYFSPKFNSYEMDYAVAGFLINNERMFKFYLFVINIDTMFYLFNLLLKMHIPQFT
jgi:hypothetical protein